MENELKPIEKEEQKVSPMRNERKCIQDENKLRKGSIVYKLGTGMPHRIVNVSIANGIEHYSLLCSETNKSYYLSKFALESDYTNDGVKVEQLGLKMVKRLSAMWDK